MLKCSDLFTGVLEKNTSPENEDTVINRPTKLFPNSILAVSRFISVVETVICSNGKV